MYRRYDCKTSLEKASEKLVHLRVTVWVCFVSLNYVKRTCRFLFDSEDTDVLVSLMGGLE